MRKIIAILLVVSTLFLCSCASEKEKEQKAQLKAVQQELLETKFETKFDAADSEIDTVYIVTFTKDTVSYQITRGDYNGQKFTYTKKSAYTLTRKYNAPYIEIEDAYFEGLRVLMASKETPSEDGKLIVGLKGDGPIYKHAYKPVK